MWKTKWSEKVLVKEITCGKYKKKPQKTKKKTQQVDLLFSTTIISKVYLWELVDSIENT